MSPYRTAAYDNDRPQPKERPLVGSDHVCSALIGAAALARIIQQLVEGGRWGAGSSAALLALIATIVAVADGASPCGRNS